MLCSNEENFIDSDDDELPSLFDRIQNLKSSPCILPCKKVSDSGSDDETEFLNLIEKISKTPQIAKNKNGASNKENISENLKSSFTTFKTPQSQVKSQILGVSSNSEDEDDFLKFSERIRNTPYLQNRNPAGRNDLSFTSDVSSKKRLFSGFNLIEKNSGSFHDQIKRTPLTQISSNRGKAVSEFLKPLNVDFKTPQLQVKSRSTAVSAVLSDSDDEDEFSKFSERIRNTPHSKNRKPDGSVSDYLISDFHEKKKLFSATSPEEKKSESSFLGAIKKTPLTQFNRRQNARSTASPAVFLSSESDDECEFSKFSEQIHSTHRSQNVIHQPQAATSDSEDDVFLNLSEKFRQLHTPRSQNQYSLDENSPLSVLPEKENVFSTPNNLDNNISNGETGPDTQTFIQSRNVKEYEKLFPLKSETPETFIRKRENYAQQLYDFFNKKIFDSQLPADLPLIWDCALLRTAGITACSANYADPSSFKCIIKLSSGLLTSFDRLQDTLLHEMCHAAVWIISQSVKVRHGPLWKIWAARCTWILPFLKCPERCHNYDGNFRFWYYCPKCNWKKGRCKQPEKYAKGSCRKCKIPLLMKFNDL